MQLTGQGISGVIAVLLEDEVGKSRYFVKVLEDKQARGGALSNLEARALEFYHKKLERFASQPPTMVGRLKKFAGTRVSRADVSSNRTLQKPESESLSEDFTPRKLSPTRGITAYPNEKGEVDLFVFEFAIGDVLLRREVATAREVRP